MYNFALQPILVPIKFTHDKTRARRISFTIEVNFVNEDQKVMTDYLKIIGLDQAHFVVKSTAA